ncbi:MAG TPA: AI-2E family transporter [Ktedonobacterales bacterium]|nr:AI-2E family transporter [Ktedonobacterales bacterium]
MPVKSQPSTAPRPLRPQRVADSRWARRRDVALAIVGWAIITGGALWLAGHIVHTLLILALAALFAYAIAPGVALLHRKLPKWLAVVIMYVIVLAVILAVLYVLFSAIVTEVTALVEQLKTLFSPGSQSANSPLIKLLKGFGVTSSQLAAARDWLTHQLASVASAATPIVTGLIGGLLDVLLVAVLSIYLLYEGPRIVAWLRRELPISQRNRGEFVIDTLQRVAGGYIRGELILCTLIGLLVGGGMYFIGVPFATLLGALAFFFEFIPFLGPIFSFVACALVGATQGWVTLLIVVVYFGFIHAIEAYIVGPRVLGRSLGLHPAISIVALLIGAEVFGLWGALFAAPLAGIVQVVLSTLWREWRSTHPTQFPQGEDQPGDDTAAPELNVFSPASEPAPEDGAPSDGRARPSETPF